MLIGQPGHRDAAAPRGAFRRRPTSFHHTIAAGTRFEPAPGRYHLYVSLACPWAHRTLIARALKGLEEVIGVTVVHWRLDHYGWRFEGDADPHGGAQRLSEL